jgi:Holin of 3TMs, for gene-transfer release
MSISQVAGAVAAGATSGPISAVSTLVGGVNDIISKFVTDPNAKLAAQQHALDLQAQLQEAALDALTKQTQAAADSAKNDHYLWGARAFFCYGFSALYLFVYSGLCTKLLHVPAPEIPMNLNLIFAGVMLGCIGIPAGIEALKQIMAMPGESQVNVLGVKIGNKS